jgi:prepilin-type N-terminal cleavage/methylation domain-containing protein
MEKNKFKNSKGFTFLEVIVAIFIISIGVVGVVKFMPSIISENSINYSRLTAAYLAQEGIEIARNIRDSNLLQGQSWDYGLNTAACNGGCEADYINASQPDPNLLSFGTGRYLYIGGSGFYGYFGATATKYKRKITFISNGNDATVTVNVLWSERGKSYGFPVQERLYNWY